MPSDLDRLAQDDEHRQLWGMSPTGNGLQDLAARQQMTHQPEQPNPAAPYLQGARDIARRTFVDPLRATGFLPQEQTPSWYGQARNIGGQLFREGPAPFIAGLAPRGGLAQLAAQSGYIPGWMNDNVISHALRSPAFTQASQFFTPLVGTLTLAPVRNNSPIFGNDKFALIHKETGQKRGDVWLSFDPQTKNLSVEYMQATPTKPGPGWTGAKNDPRRWGLGGNPIEAALELRSALPEVYRFYPDMKTVEFYGVGGAKGAHAVSANLKFEVEKTPDGQVSWKKIKHQRYGNPISPSQPPPPVSPQPPETGTASETLPDYQSRRAEPPRPSGQSPEQARQDASAQSQIASHLMENWDQMRRRQDTEWNEMMRRLRENL